MKDRSRKERLAPSRDSTAAGRSAERIGIHHKTNFRRDKKTPPSHQKSARGASAHAVDPLRDRAHFGTRSRSVKGPNAEPRRLATSGIAAFGRTSQPINQHRGRSAERIGIRRKTYFRRDVLARREGELAFVPRARPSRRRQAPRHPPKVRLIRRRACCCKTAPATHRGW